MAAGKNDAMTLTLGIDPGLNRTGYAVIERGPRGPLLREVADSAEPV